MTVNVHTNRRLRSHVHPRHGGDRSCGTSARGKEKKIREMRPDDELCFGGEKILLLSKHTRAHRSREK